VGRKIWGIASIVPIVAERNQHNGFVRIVVQKSAITINFVGNVVVNWMSRKMKLPDADFLPVRDILRSSTRELRSTL
jgi:hypothetical protein